MTRTWRIVLVALATLIGGVPYAGAETATSGSQQDARIQVVPFTGDIVRILTAEGVATTIELDKKETIRDFAMGDRDAWHAKQSGNLFLLKPKEPKGDTNLTIFTDKRAYLFELVMLKKKNASVAYWVRMQYPEDMGTTCFAAGYAKNTLGGVFFTLPPPFDSPPDCRSATWP